MTTTDPTTALGAIRAIVGDPFVRDAAPADAVRGVTPRIVVEPADARQVGEVLAAATAAGLTVVPRGGGTKLDWGNRPRRVDAIVSTSRLDQIVEHAWADLTVTVQAGCTIQALQDALRTHGQRVAVDPLWPERATVGGVLAANDAGALRLRFGGLRDLIIGSTIALADGTLASSGGKVVKNVAGYDLSKLVTGALGTLGVVTSAIFRLHPLPQQARTLSAEVRDPAGAQHVMQALQDSTLVHAALQVRTSSSAPINVDMLFEGTAAGIDAQTHLARTLAGGVRLDESPASVWQARQDLWNAAGPVLKISGLVSELARMLGEIRRVADAAGVESHVVFQATGVGCVSLSPAREGWPELLRRVRASMADASGRVTVLRPALPDDTADSWPGTGDAQPLMDAVKQQFDPTRTLNPGRFVGGI